MADIVIRGGQVIDGTGARGGWGNPSLERPLFRPLMADRLAADLFIGRGVGPVV